MPPKPDTTVKAIQAGLLTWLVPGLGHYILGHRALAIVFFIAISIPYFCGLAIGGALNSVNPRTNPWLFLAEVGIAGYTGPSYLLGHQLEASVQRRQQTNEAVDLTRYIAYYPGSDVAQIYLATAGLLNLLAILDAIARAQTAGLPTYRRELAPATEEGGA